MAVLATMIARVGGSKRAKPADFMPTFDGPGRQQTPQQMQAIARQFAENYNRNRNRK